MKKTFKIEIDGMETEITFTEVTAINPCDNERVYGLHYHEAKDEFCDGDGIIFDVTFPEDEGDVINILGYDSEYMVTDGFILETERIIINDQQFNTIFKAALADDGTNKKLFVNKWSCDVIFAGDENEKYYIGQEIAKIYDISHMSIKDIRTQTGLSQAKFAEKFCIPKRTLENWEMGVNECPSYTRLMLAQVSGIYYKGTEKE